MSSLIQEATIKIRRDSAGNWTSTNPTPLQGEWCLETDTGNIKIGDGSTAWTSLLYYDATMIGTQKNFFTYKDRTDWGYLPLAFDNAVSTTTYSALYAEVGDVFEAQHVAAGDDASGAGMFYPTPIPGAYDRAGIPDIEFTAVIDDGGDISVISNQFLNGHRDGTPFRYEYISGTAPSTLVDGDIYYMRFGSSNNCVFYPTEADAVASTNALSFSSTGSGTFRLTQEGIVLDDAFQGHINNPMVVSSGGTKPIRFSQVVDTDAAAPGTPTNYFEGYSEDNAGNGIPRPTNETRPKTNYTFGYIKARKV